MAKKILIANLASPENPGDHAILMGTIKALKSIFKEVEITIVTRAISYQEYYLREGLHTIASYPNVDRLNVDDSWTKLIRLPQTLLAPGDLRKAVKNSDLVFLAGGAYFYSYRKGIPGLTYLSHVSTSYWAKKYAKPVFLLPQSYGPFHSLIARNLFEYVLRNANKIYYRESITGDYLKEEFKPYFAKAKAMPDLALFLAKNELLSDMEIPKTEGVKTIGVTIRPWEIEGDNARDYAKKLSEALSVVSRKERLKIKIIVQVMDQKKTEGDETISHYLKELLTKSMPSGDIEIFCQKPFFSLTEISRIYASCDMLIGMRLHSSLLSLIVGCPALTVGYQHKADGILKTLNLTDLYLGSYRNVSINQLVDKILEIIDDKDGLLVRIEEQLALARRQISESFKEVLK